MKKILLHLRLELFDAFDHITRKGVVITRGAVGKTLRTVTSRANIVLFDHCKTKRMTSLSFAI